MLKVACIGIGYWGNNILRNLIEINNIEVVAICDKNINFFSSISNKNKKIKFFKDFDELLAICDIDAVFISTPSNIHFTQAKKALLKNLHVFVEKPLTLSLNEAVELNTLAIKNNVKLMVGYVFLYKPCLRAAVIKVLKEIVFQAAIRFQVLPKSRYAKACSERASERMSE